MQWNAFLKTTKIVYYTLFSDAGQTRPVGAEQVTDGEPLAALHTYFHFSHLPAFAHSSPEFLELHIFKYYPLHPCLQGSRLPTPLACSPGCGFVGRLRVCVVEAVLPPAKEV